MWLMTEIFFLFIQNSNQALPLKSFQAIPFGKRFELVLEWEDEAGSKDMTQVIKMFSLVTVDIMADKMPLKFKVRFSCRMLNCNL